MGQKSNSQKLDEIEQVDFPDEISDEDRKDALRLINVDPDKPLPLEERLAIHHDNKAMLSDKGKFKKSTTGERVRALFQENNFSPLASLVRLVKVEEAKMEAMHRAECMGLSQRMLDALPKPDKRFYANLLTQLAKYEVPELKSVEINGEIAMGMAVHIVNHVPQQKIVNVDAGAPDSIKKIYGQSTDATFTVVEKVKAVLVEAITDDI